METLVSEPSTPSRATDSKPQISSPLPSSSVLRLWRPAAQRNLRNQWSKLASFRDQWSSISSTALSHATALVNSHLSQRYMPHTELGVLSDMPDIRKKACLKLFKQQELHSSKLLLSYKGMVGVVSKMINVIRSMKCFFRGSNNSPLLQFSYNSEDQNDTGDSGDGGGIPVFTFFSISSHDYTEKILPFHLPYLIPVVYISPSFCMMDPRHETQSWYEKFAEELVQMFKLELCLKRLLVLELISIGYDASQVEQLHWSAQLYDDEFKDLSVCNLYCEVTCGPVPPRLRDGKSDMAALRFDSQPKPEVLQVYLTTWLTELNINTFRVNEIFAVVAEEMHVSSLG